MSAPWEDSSDTQEASTSVEEVAPWESAEVETVTEDELDDMADSHTVEGAAKVTNSGEVIPIHNLVKLKQDMGTEGEEYSYLVVFLTAAGGGGMVAVVGPSRSGKDRIVDAVEAGFHQPFSVVPTSAGSEAGLFRARRDLNNAAVHRYEDMVDMTENIEDMMKMHGEGKDKFRRRGMGNNDSDVSRPGQGYEVDTDAGMVKETLFAPRAQVFFLASDNDRVSLSDFKEVENRAIVIPTDSSQDLTEDIQERQIDERMFDYEQNLEPDYVNEVRDYVDDIPHNQWEIGAKENGVINPDFWNPCLGPFKDEHPIPSERVESRFDSYRLLDFFEIVCLWHHKNRMKVSMENKGASKDRMLIAPKDVWLTQRIYGKKLILSALSLRSIDMNILTFLRETGQEYTVSQLTQVLTQAGFNVTTRNVRNSLDSMFDNNYVRKDNSGNSTVTFGAAPFASVVDDFRAIDYEKVIEGTKKKARESLPEAEAEEYIERFCEGPNVTDVTHPITGESHDIREYQGFKEQIEEQQENLEEMLGSSIYEDNSSQGSEDTDDSGNANHNGDGKLGAFEMS